MKLTRILMTVVLMMTMLSCQSEEERQANELREKLSKMADETEQMYHEAIAMQKQELETMKDVPRADGRTRIIDSYMLTESKIKRSEKSLPFELERLEKAREAIQGTDLEQAERAVNHLYIGARMKVEFAEGSLKVARQDAERRKQQGR